MRLLAHLVERHLAKVGVAEFEPRQPAPLLLKIAYAAVAHLVERHLAKGGVAKFEPRQPLQLIHLRKRVDFYFLVAED